VGPLCDQVGLALVSGGHVIAGAMGLPNMPWATNIPPTPVPHPTGSETTGEYPSSGSSMADRSSETTGVDPSSGRGSEEGGNSLGLVIAAQQGQGCWVGAVPPATYTQQAGGPQEPPTAYPQEGLAPSDRPAAAEPPRWYTPVQPPNTEGAPLWALGRGDFFRCSVDSVGAAAAGVVCISDHERWEDLPLARGLRGSPTPREGGAHKPLKSCPSAAAGEAPGTSTARQPLVAFWYASLWCTPHMPASCWGRQTLSG